MGTRRPDNGDDNGRVIDAVQWMEERVDSLIAAQRFDDAIRYVRKLVLNAHGDDEIRRCATYLGYLYLLVGDLHQAKRWLKRARQIDPVDPHLAYALGHTAVAQRDYSLAAVYFLEAFVEAEQPHDEAEFLRCAALAMMREVGPDAPVATMLLGALDRDLGSPWILDALARVYEADQRWMESLQALSTLAEVVRGAAGSVVLHRAPPARQLLRNRLMGSPATPEELRRRARAINEAMRAQFEVVLDAHRRRDPMGLAPLRSPTALSRLIRMLDWHDRGVELIETAHQLWARATDEDFHQMLGAARLAAAIHLLVERLHWRVPTPIEEVARLHGAAAGAIPAAARVVAGRLELELFDEKALKAPLNLKQRRQLEQIRRALLFGEGLAAVRAPEIRLG